MYSYVNFMYIDRWLIYICVCVCVCMCVCMYVCMYGRYRPYIWARWVVEIMKSWQLILIVYIVKILVWKPNSFFFFSFLFFYILITLVGLHNTYVLNYIRNIKNKNKNLHTKHQKTFLSSFSRSLPNTGKWYNFLENALWKMNHFPENFYAETNRALFFRQKGRRDGPKYFLLNIMG